jgi:hypothetical protein
MRTITFWPGASESMPCRRSTAACTKMSPSRLARHEAIAALVVVPLDQRRDVFADRDRLRCGGGLGVVLTRVDESTSSTFMTCQPFGPRTPNKHRGAGLEILMPGLPQCRYMQERVAVVSLESKKSIALYGIEPLDPTTQLD